MSSENPTTNLGEVLRRWRVNEGLTLAEASRTIGIGGAATLMRIEHGHIFDAITMMKVWAWLLTKRPSGQPPRARAK